MILIADGGSTKADWIAIDNNKQERFRVRTLGLNPAVISSEELTNRIINMFQLINIAADAGECVEASFCCPARVTDEIAVSGGMMPLKLAELGAHGGGFSALLGPVPLKAWCSTAAWVPMARPTQRLTRGSA